MPSKSQEKASLFFVQSVIVASERNEFSQLASALSAFVKLLRCPGVWVMKVTISTMVKAAEGEAVPPPNANLFPH